MKKEDIVQIIRTEAEKQGVDPDLAVRVAEVESRLDPKAKNPKSTAGGLFQFLDATWKELGGDPRSKFDPVQNARLGATYMRQNRDRLMATLGREPRSSEQYLAHLLGPTGARAVLTADPDAPIRDVVASFSPKRADQIVKNNRLSGSVRDVIADFDQRFGSAPVMESRPKDRGPRPTPKLAPLEERKDVPFGTYGAVPAPDVLASYGPSYQAAFAAAKLASLQDEGEGGVEAPAPTQARTMLSALQGMPGFSAFQPPQPIQMADGGEAKSLLQKLNELPAKAADKLTELALKAYRAAGDEESMPANQKVFLDTFLDKNKGQITEEFFNEAELRAIGNMIAAKGGEKGSIRYDDYTPFMKPEETSIAAGVLKAGKNPYESVRTTLGQFNYRKDPVTQQYVVEDKYDFNRLGSTDPLRRVEQAYSMSDYVAHPDMINPGNLNPYAVLRMYAGRNMPEGQGRPVSVNVPNFSDGGDVSRQDPMVEIPGLGEDGGALVLPRSQAEEFLRRLQLSASAREMDMTVPDMGLAPQVVGSQASGRIGYETEGGFGGGVSGYYVKPDNASGMGGVGEIDASYRAGANRIGAAYNPGMDSMRYFYERNTPEGAMGVGYMPDQKAVNFFLNRRFSDGGEVLEAPPVEVTESRSMLDKLLGQREKMLRSGLGTAADIAASVVNPLYGTAAAMADLETARREDDKLGMALSSLGMIPVAGGIIRGGGKLMQRIGKEGAESGGMSSREALEASMGDLPGRVKQAWFDLATVDLTNTKETRRLLEQAENLDVFTEAQSKKAREAIDLFEKGMIDEETLNNLLTDSVLSPLTQMWTKFEKRLGPIDVKDK